jgi:hypothetical protein
MTKSGILTKRKKTEDRIETVTVRRKAIKNSRRKGK